MIVTVTLNPAVDQTIKMNTGLESESVQRSVEAQFTSGGNGVNVSQFLQALGSETAATGLIGGFTGYFIEEDLDTYDVPTDFVWVAGVTRINTTILTPRKKYQLNQTGPTVDSDVIDELIEIVSQYEPDTLNIGGSLLPGMDAADVDRIATAGDWDTAVEVPGEVLAELDAEYEYCKPNRKELAAATGREIESVTECVDAAKTLQERGFECVIASMGSDGAVMVTPEETLYAPALDVEVVDTLGAGDSMLAAVLWAFEQGWDAERALRAGVVASAQLVGVMGSSVRELDPEPRLDEVRIWAMDS
ncbi:Fructose-1-phosphate kinase protein [Halorhabdus tiamatea SARL4B]|uniref:Fructose-1-phosphate kinase protein n=1 Tax=Halorhabdus tiamatea SARL4B TaxID=1033806 RepID=F7PGM1_9EURY|nr:1-phosphofructokinase [Halorhabdus tiamatea]ERJ05041.1 Fructose-1-phosphate kinase protein [Halorhabdus tiamatea SARL4B]